MSILEISAITIVCLIAAYIFRSLWLVIEKEIMKCSHKKQSWRQLNITFGQLFENDVFIVSVEVNGVYQIGSIVERGGCLWERVK